MKEQIKKCIEFLKELSIIEPVEIRVEEITERTVVLSYTEKSNYPFARDRIYKEFKFNPFSKDVLSMKCFK